MRLLPRWSSRPAARAPAVPRRCRLQRPPCRRRARRSSARPATISAAAALSSTMSRSGPFSPSSKSRISAALCAGSPPFRSSRRARAQPGLLGDDIEVRDPAVVEFGDLGRARRWSISSMPSPCTTQARSLPSCPSTSAIGRTHCGANTPTSEAPRPGRVGQRPQQVEDRAGAELDAGRADVAGGAVVARRHQEADAGLPQAAPHDRHVGVDIDAERGQHVGRARFRREIAVAVLGHRHAAAGDDERGRGRDVEGAGARRRRCRRCRSRPAARRSSSAFARMVRAAPVISSTRLAAHPQRHQEAAHLRRRGVAAHDDVERSSRPRSRRATGRLPPRPTAAAGRPAPSRSSGRSSGAARDHGAVAGKTAAHAARSVPLPNARDSTPCIAKLRRCVRPVHPGRPGDALDVAHGGGMHKNLVIPGRTEGPNPEPIFQRPVFMGSGLTACGAAPE